MKFVTIATVSMVLLSQAAFGVIVCKERVSEKDYGWAIFDACVTLQKPDVSLDEVSQLAPKYFRKFDPQIEKNSSRRLVELLKSVEALQTAVKIKNRINQDFIRAQNFLRAPGNWKLCPSEVFRECTVIALSVDDNDPDGKMLNGKAAPPAFRYDLQGELELLTIFADRIGAPENDAKASAWLIELKSTIHTYAVDLSELPSNMQKIKALLRDEIQPAVEELIHELSPEKRASTEKLN